MSGPVVAADDLGIRYPDADADALSGVTLAVRPGEVVGVVGHAGSGRSTFLGSLNGIVPSLRRATMTGRLTVAGMDPSLTPVSAMAGRVAIVLDDPESWMSQFSVEEEVAFGLECLGTPAAEMRRRVPAVLERIGLTAFARRAPLTLSGGEQQRLAIACASAVDPVLLLLDDPTAHLDPVNARVVMGLAVEHARHAGAAVIVASDDVDLLAEVADRVIALEGGRLVADGPARDVFAEGARTGRWPVPAVTSAFARIEPGATSLPVTVDEAARAAATMEVALADVLPAPEHENGGEASPRPAAALQLRGVSYRYPGANRDAVDAVSLEVSPGEIVALAGESGSGKSTLARLAAGLLPPSAGSVLASGQPLAAIARRDVASRVGLVFQNPNHQLLASTVAEELALGPRNQGLPATEIDRRVKDVAESLGLTPVLGVHPYRLGMAERKRVTIGAVLAMATPVLILDEPTSGHDQANRDAVAARLRMTAALGSAVLVITHDLAFAEQVAHRLVVLRDGRVVASGATPAVLEDTEGLARAGLESPPLHRLRAALRTPADGPAAGSPG